MRIGVLTGGGDVPGLNPCIKAVVNRAHAAGWDVVGIRRGWGGLLNYNPDNPEACRSIVLSDYDLFVFALAERKNEKKRIIKHHSAEG